MRKTLSHICFCFWEPAKAGVFLFSFMWTFLFCFFPLTGQAIPQTGPGSLNVWLDYASFRNLPDAHESYVEIYYSFNRRELSFAREGEAYEARLFLNLTIENELGDTLENRMWNRRSKVNRWEDTQTDYMILDEVRVILQPGNYLLKLLVTDLGSESQGEASLEMKVKEFGEEKLQLSDLELAYRIDPDTSAGMFTKAGRKILPNPSGVLSRRMGVMYFYAELYDLHFLPGAESDYLLSINVLNSSGRKLKDFGSQTRKKPGNSAVVLSGINVSTLPQGHYILQVEAQDQEAGQKALATKKFSILGEEGQSEGSLVSLEEVERFRRDVTYIATSGELDMIDQLNLEGKKRFIDEFWRKRDPDPNTPINEFKIEHYRRIGYANSHFSRTREANDGWHTDMGRIYVLHGEPSEIERNPLTLDTRSWEQWNYNELEGGVYFIFIDEDGYGVYRLVHSNLKGEVKDYLWEEKVRVGSPFR